jgi:hypothetical protein
MWNSKLFSHCVPFTTQLIYPVRAMVQALFVFPVTQQPHWSLGLLIVEVSRSYADTHAHALGGAPLNE